MERTGLSWLGGVVVEFVALYPNTHIIFWFVNMIIDSCCHRLHVGFNPTERYLHSILTTVDDGISNNLRGRKLYSGDVRQSAKKKPSCTEETDLPPVSMASIHSNRHFNPCRIGRVTCIWSQGVFIDTLTFSLDIR
jgi:hypothetical protein